MSAADVERVGRLLRGEEPNKWIELSELFDGIRLGGLKPDSLASEDRKWRAVRGEK